MSLRVRLRHADEVREFLFDRRDISFGCGKFNDVVLDADCGTTLQGTLETEEGLSFRVRTSGLSTRLVRDGELVARIAEEDEGTLELEVGDTLEFGAEPGVEVEIVERDEETDEGGLETVPLPAVDEVETTPELDDLLWRATRRAGRDCSPEVLLRAAGALVEQLTGTGPNQVMLSVLEDEGRPRDQVYRLTASDDSETGTSSNSAPDADRLFPGTFERIRAPLAGLGVDRRDTFSNLESGTEAAVRTGSSPIVFIPVGPEAMPGVIELEFAEPISDTDSIRALGALLQPLGCIVLRTVAKELERLSLAEENRYFRQRERRDYLFKDLVSESEAMQEVYRTLHDWVDRDESVLIVGEAGAGKSLLARALHHLSTDDDDDMLISLDCRALDDETLDSELFGCVESELVGAVAPRKGAFELADGGTVFLDEIDLLSPMLQSKLTRVLKEGEVRRIGDSVGRRVGARLVASTHRDLEALVDEGAFRRELYLMLCDHRLEVPPLRERRADIVPLAHVYLETFADRYERACRTFSEAVESRLKEHDWRGNARELKAVVESTVLKTDGEEVVGEEHLAL